MISNNIPPFTKKKKLKKKCLYPFIKFHIKFIHLFYLTEKKLWISCKWTLILFKFKKNDFAWIISLAISSSEVLFSLQVNLYLRDDLYTFYFLSSILYFFFLLNVELPQRGILNENKQKEVSKFHFYEFVENDTIFFCNFFVNSVANRI